MNRIIIIAPIIVLSVLFIAMLNGCGTNPTGGGGGAAFNADIYVSTTGSDTPPDGDGSRAHPFKTIAHAMEVVGSHETIGVMAGTYNEYVEWTTMEGVTLKGESKTTTIISREGISNIAIGIGYTPTLPPGQTLTIESMTIRDCWPDYGETGGAVSIWSPSITVHLKNVVFNDNYNDDSSNDSWGGAVGADGSTGALTVVIEGCSFIDNYGGLDGGAVYGSSDVYYIVKNCLFKGNSVSNNDNGGGAIYTERYISIESSCFAENHSGSDGGAVLTYPTSADDGIYSVNCLFLNNSADYYGGACESISSPGSPVTVEVVNCTFVSNEAISGHGGSYGGGIYTYLGSLKVKNCIVWGNISLDNTDRADIYVESGNLDINYSDTVNVTPVYTGGVGTTDAYPEFAYFPPRTDHPEDLKLTASTTIEISKQGTFEGAPGFDIDGKPRSGYFSMGAYQY